MEPTKLNQIFKLGRHLKYSLIKPKEREERVIEFKNCINELTDEERKELISNMFSPEVIGELEEIFKIDPVLFEGYESELRSIEGSMITLVGLIPTLVNPELTKEEFANKLLEVMKYSWVIARREEILLDFIMEREIHYIQSLTL